MTSAEHRFRRPESVLVAVATRTGQTLILRRADQPDLWQSVTGSLEWGEQAEQTARRELAEETGIRAQPDATGITRQFEILRHWRPRYRPGTQWNTEYEFRVLLDDIVPVTLAETEHLEHLWLPFREGADKVFSWTNREALQDWARELGF